MNYPNLLKVRWILDVLGASFRRILGRALVQILRIVYPPVNAIFKRVQSSPGLPVSNPSSSYWMQPPSPISTHNSTTDIPLPEYADIVIIGSGITGTAFARTILDQNSGCDLNGDPLKIAMIDAREICSGATGRNGGHITPILYHDYGDLKRKHGKLTAQKIIRFRLAHISQLLQVAKEEDLLDDSQGREVEAFDVFFHKGLFEQARLLLKEYQEDLPDESADYRIYEDPEELQRLQLSKSVAGCLSTRAGAVHPYRLVTGILTRLLKAYPTNFDIFTRTPCTQITSPGKTDNCYTVVTPRGTIRTRHVIHATNGWASHLLPGLRGIIFPARGVMTAQVPRRGLGEVIAKPGDHNDMESKSASPSSWIGQRSFVFYPRSTVATYDYLTQQLPSTGPATSYPHPCGELMFGGGFAGAIMTEIGTADDSEWNASVREYLSTALSRDFSIKPDGKKEDAEEVKATWSGVLGFSADERPWVGRIPDRVTGRASGSSTEQSSAGPGLGRPGEWIAAGYSGEGMVHAWMSGKALAYMVLGQKLEDWFPEEFMITEERWEKSEFEDLMGTYLVP